MVSLNALEKIQRNILLFQYQLVEHLIMVKIYYIDLKLIKTLMLRYSLCDYGDTYILVKGNISVNNTAAAGADASNTNKKVIFKNCAPFTDCISKINNTQVDNAKDIDIVMPMYNLIEYSDNYSKTSGSLRQYCKDIPAVSNNGDIVDFNGANVTDSFNFKTGQTDNNGRIYNVEIMVLLKFLKYH